MQAGCKITAKVVTRGDLVRFVRIQECLFPNNRDVFTREIQDNAVGCAFLVKIQFQSKLLRLVRELRRAFLMTVLIMIFHSARFFMARLTVLLDQRVIGVSKVIRNALKQPSVKIGAPFQGPDLGVCRRKYSFFLTVLITVLITVLVTVVIACLIVVVFCLMIRLTMTTHLFFVFIGVNRNTVNRLLARERGAHIAPLPHFRDTKLVGFTLRIRIQ